MTGAPALAVDRRRFSLDEFLRMAEVGILGEDERVELFQGELIAMSPTGLGHANCLERLLSLLFRLLGERARIWSQSTLPFRLDGRDHAPMPDVAVLVPRRYARSYPVPRDVLLAVEVADTSQAHDRAKIRLYGRAGIRESWLVDLRTRCVIVHRLPDPDGYRRVLRVSRTGSLTIEAFPGVGLRVSDLL